MNQETLGDKRKRKLNKSLAERVNSETVSVPPKPSIDQQLLYAFFRGERGISGYEGFTFEGDDLRHRTSKVFKSPILEVCSSEDNIYVSDGRRIDVLGSKAACLDSLPSGKIVTALHHHNDVVYLGTRQGDLAIAGGDNMFWKNHGDTFAIRSICVLNDKFYMAIDSYLYRCKNGLDISADFELIGGLKESITDVVSQDGSLYVSTINGVIYQLNIQENPQLLNEIGNFSTEVTALASYNGQLYVGTNLNNGPPRTGAIFTLEGEKKAELTSKLPIAALCVSKRQ